MLGNRSPHKHQRAYYGNTSILLKQSGLEGRFSWQEETLAP